MPRKTEYDWPGAMTRKTLAAYLDVSEAGVEREVAAGRLPPSFQLGSKKHWLKRDIDQAIDRICGGNDRRYDHNEWADLE